MEIPERSAVIAASMQLAAGNDVDLAPVNLINSLTDLAGAASPFPASIGIECAALLEAVRAQPVVTLSDAEWMADAVTRANTSAKEIDKRRKDFTGFFDRAKDNVMGWVRPYIADLDSAVNIGKKKLADYQAAERAAAVERQRKLDAEAALERRRLKEAAAAEAARAQEEERQIRQRAEDARKAGNQALADKLDVRAESKAEAAQERIADIATAAAMTSAPVVEQAPTKLVGISGREKWVVTITDRAKLLECLAGNAQYHHLLNIDEGGLNKLANLFKEGFSMPGCKATPETVIAARATRKGQ